MSANYFIGDTHYGHNGISEKFRNQFSSDEEHTMTIHENVMACAGKRNTIYLMGDIVFKEEYERLIQEYSEYFDRVIWVLGNHDHLSVAKRCMMLDNVYCVGIQKRFGSWLTHAPVHPDELRGKWNIHGHVHTATIPDVRYLNISCENVGYRPIELQQIRNIFRQRRESGMLV